MKYTLQILLLSIFLGSAALADDSSLKGSFNGGFLIGVRSVDVGGSQNKFDQHFHLEDGPRLFDLHFDFVAAKDDDSLVDRVQLDLDNFGGDPFETLHLAVDRYGKFKMRYHRSKSVYFYEDILLPLDQSTPSLSNAGDFHHFDFERVRDRAAFDFELNDRASLHFGFDRYVKEGESTTTLDVQRDEFELDRPIDERLDDYTFGFQYAFKNATLSLEERYRDYDNAYEIFLPGFSRGEDPDDATTLDFFFLDQPYGFESYRHTARLNFKPNPRFILRAAASLENLDLDIEADETSQGTDFRGGPFTTAFTGDGDIERDLELFDVDISYLITGRLAVTGAARQSSLDQEGAFLFGDDVEEGSWEIDRLSFEAGLSFDVSSELSVAGGVRHETREVLSGHDLTDLDREETDHTGLFARVDWRPDKQTHVDFSYEDSSYDDPFTLASATDRQRLRLQGRHHFENGLYVKGVYLINRYENALSGWEADRDQVDLRVGCTMDHFEGSFGYSLAETDRSIDQLITTRPGFGGGVTFDYLIFFESEASFYEGRAVFKPSALWIVGADFRRYENDGTFPLEREDLRAFAEWVFKTRYRLHLGWRTVDFEENLFGFNNYDADIAELSVGYHW